MQSYQNVIFLQKMSEILFLVLHDENLPKNSWSRVSLRQNYTSIRNFDKFLHSFQYD